MRDRTSPILASYLQNKQQLDTYDELRENPVKRNLMAIAIALVVAVLTFVISYMKYGEGLDVPEAISGSLLTFALFWAVSWIMLSPDPDLAAMNEENRPW